MKRLVVVNLVLWLIGAALVAVGSEVSLLGDYATEFSVDFAEDITSVLAERWGDYKLESGLPFPWSQLAQTLHAPADPALKVEVCEEALCFTREFLDELGCCGCYYETGIGSQFFAGAGGFEVVCAIEVRELVDEMVLGCELIASNDERIKLTVNLTDEWCWLERGRAWGGFYDFIWDNVGSIEMNQAPNDATHTLRLQYDAAQQIIRARLDGRVVGVSNLSEWSGAQLRAVKLELYVGSTCNAPVPVDVEIVELIVGFSG